MNLCCSTIGKSRTLPRALSIVSGWRLATNLNRGIQTMENNTNTDIVLNDPKTKANLSARVSSLALASIPQETQGLMLRMFADPYILEKDERASLLAQLRDCVKH